jgi:twitching motility two-component system response regulator PilH
MRPLKKRGQTSQMNTIEEIASDNATPFSLPSIQARNTRGTILIVEDDRSIRRYLEVILQRAGYCVVVAADGLEAMKAALTAAIDAVVTDAIMPHLNGYELCRFLRHHPKLSDLPVVLLSGFERADAAQDVTDRPDVYLAKPVRPEELTGCLARLLLKAA